jgi:hypothetical protein
MTNQEEAKISSLILAIRGQKVILDGDLAKLYGVSTKRINEQVRRNADRFPEDFVFQLSAQEDNDLRSQIATSNGRTVREQHPIKRTRGGRRYLPYAFTEHGAIMAANVLNSPRAVQMSVFVVRAFVRMRSMMRDKGELAWRLTMLEKELKERLDVHESAIVSILQRIMDIIDPPDLPGPPRKTIGFKVK